MTMDEKIREQRRKQAILARHHIYSEKVQPQSYVSSLSPDEREKFMEDARAANKVLLRKRKRRSGVAKVFGTAFLSVAAIIAILPIFFTFLNSFMSSAEIEGNYGVVFKSLPGGSNEASRFMDEAPQLQLIPQEVSADQYSEVLFKSPSYLFRYWNSFLLTVPIVIGQLAVACMASYSFMRYRKKRREVLFFLYIILMLMPFQVTLVPNYIMNEALNILDTPLAVILPGIFSTFSVYILTKYMRRIPKAYIEAAIIDGASEWQIFTKVVMPNCKAPVAAMAILLFIDYWNMVEQPLVMIQDEGMQPLSVFLSKVNVENIGLAFAACALYMIPPLLIFLRGEDQLVEGISQSGIK